MNETRPSSTEDHPSAARAAALPGVAGCWCALGTHGNGTCSQLPLHIHCRNCPTYAKAAADTLNRPLPPDYAQYWAEHVAQDTRLQRLSPTSAVPFRVASEWLALPTRCFQEIAERRPIHSIPHAHPTVLGLANVRGELLTCVSLGHLLGLANVPPRRILRGKYERLLVLHWAGQRIGFPADEVDSPRRFSADSVEPPPAALAKANPTYAQGVLQWQHRTLVLMDPDLLFSALNRNLT